MSYLTVFDLISFYSTKERWKRVEYSPSYSVSSFGRVKRNSSGKILSPSCAHGYEFVTLSENGVINQTRIHKLVVSAFLGNPPFEGAIVCHIDNNKTNNKVINLRWGTPTDNMRDRERHGTRVRGVDVYGAKLKESEIIEIRNLLKNKDIKQTEIAEMFNVSPSTIHLIKRNKIWSHV